MLEYPLNQIFTEKLHVCHSWSLQSTRSFFFSMVSPHLSYHGTVSSMTMIIFFLVDKSTMSCLILISYSVQIPGRNFKPKFSDWYRKLLCFIMPYKGCIFHLTNNICLYDEICKFLQMTIMVRNNKESNKLLVTQ